MSCHGGDLGAAQPGEATAGRGPRRETGAPARARNATWICGLAGLALCLAASAWAQAPIIYPSKGQSAAQQSKDEGECYVWAKQTTGIDPAALAAEPAAAAPPAYGGGQRFRGAARGAAGGAAIGAIAGDAGKGAAIGAITGTMLGGRQARMAQSAGVQQSQAQRQQLVDTYYRAVSACMVGRGYTVE